MLEEAINGATHGIDQVVDADFKSVGLTRFLLSVTKI
jgi:hypothetical protein